MNENILELVEEYFRIRSKLHKGEKIFKRYMKIAEYFNRCISEDNFILKNSNDFEATFFSGIYIDSDFEFILLLFYKHTKGHFFSNGNKRTALKLFKYLINNITPFDLYKYPDIEKIQIKAIQNKITEEEFYMEIKDNLKIKKIKTTQKVQLEHLIKRASVTENSMQIATRLKNDLTLSDLNKGNIFFKQLRKPYFQRDTNSWTVDRLEKIIKSFVNDMLIPSVILWNSKKDGIFIVDGAHRISALASWVNDDYGESVYDKNHIMIKDYIDSTIGSYSSFIEKNDEHSVIIASKSISIEWINGDYENVKDSFIQINQQGVAITNDEKELIKNDTKPSSQLSRKILSHAGGQDIYDNDGYSKEIFKLLFEPTYDRESGIYPMCGDIKDEFIIGRIFNLVKCFENTNNIEYSNLENDCYKTIKLIVDKLQLCNRVYFYGKTSMYKQSALIGISLFVNKLEKEQSIDEFIGVRKKFEDFLISYPEHIQQIVRDGRYVKKSTRKILNYYLEIFTVLKNGSNDLSEITNRFNEKKVSNRTKIIDRQYNEEIRALKKCVYCGGYLNNYSTSEYHKYCFEKNNG
jgi:prophage maintenance system killer protein